MDTRPAEAARDGRLDLIRLAMAHIEAENVHSVERTMATVAEDGAVYRIYSTGESFHARDAVRSFYAAVMEGIPDMRVEVENVIADETRRQVFAQYVFTGTHLGMLWGLAPTRRTVRYHGGILYEFGADGRLTREETYFDKTEALASLGVIRDPNTRWGAFLLIFPQRPLLLLRSLWASIFRRKSARVAG